MLRIILQGDDGKGFRAKFRRFYVSISLLNADIKWRVEDRAKAIQTA